MAEGKLSSVNYKTARAAHLLKHTVVSHHSGLDYRNVSLSIPQGALEERNTTEVVNKLNK